MTIPSQLSKADAKILSQVFDPESGPAKAEVLVDPSLPQDRHISDAALLVDLRQREKAAIRCIEDYERSSDRTANARHEAFRAALNTLNRIIEEYPDYASARNNRAQLRRWRFGDRNTICRPASATKREPAETSVPAVSDLQKAIALASPKRPQDAVSPTQGKLLAQAHTQLGALYLAASKDMIDIPVAEVEMVDDLFEGWTKESFEEEASRCFYLGGLYGNEVAKALAVHTNPHAKLCGSIVKEAMRKEFARVEA